MSIVPPDVRHPDRAPTVAFDFRVHASLVRPVLYLGVERHVIALEATLCAALVFGLGIAPGTLGFAATVAIGIHPVFAWLTARDPQATEIYLRSRRYADWYAPNAAVHSPTPRTRASVPAVR